MSRAEVTTRVMVNASPEKVWKYLCDAHMTTAAPWCFQLGVPTPKQCRIIGEASGVGAHRQCQTDRGFIDQRITEWLPPRRLTFVATSDTIGMYRHVREMQDTFLLEPVSGGTELTRLTRFETKGIFGALKAYLFRLTIRRLHRYVMENFKALAEAA